MVRNFRFKETNKIINQKRKKYIIQTNVKKCCKRLVFYGPLRRSHEIGTCGLLFFSFFSMFLIKNVYYEKSI